MQSIPSSFQEKMLQHLGEDSRVRYSGLFIAALILLTGLIISSWLFWDFYQSDHEMMQSVTSKFVTFFIFNIMVFFIGVGVTFQRIRFDLSEKLLWYANFGTLHRWRSIKVSEVSSVFLSKASKNLNVMVDQLEITTANPKNGEADRVHRLIDSRIFPGAFGPDSKLFTDVVEYIMILNPKAHTDHALYGECK
jgi:hypothetical protein